MKRTMIFFLLAAGLALPARGDEIKGNIGIVSDFVFRGISQTDNKPALQGGADYYHDQGWYAGTWGSNVDLPGSDADARVDLYGGYRAKSEQGIRWDVGLIHYAFVGDSDLNYLGLYGGATVGPLSAKLTYVPDSDSYYNGFYIETGWRQDIGSGVNLNLHAGQSLLDNARDYFDVAVGVSKVFAGLEVGLTLTDTTIKPRSDLSDTIIFLSGKYVF